MRITRLLGVTGAFAATAALAACGNSASDNAGGAPSGEVTGEVSGTINVWTWDGAPGDDTMKQLAADFEKETGVKVVSKVIDRETYTSQVQLALNSGDDIDVLGVQPSAFADQVKDKLRPVADYEAQLSQGLDGYADTAMEQMETLYGGGELYSVPLGSTGSAVCFYNADILSEVGVEPPATWDDVAALTDALEAERPGTLTLVKPSGADTWFEDEFVLTMAGAVDPGFYDSVRYDQEPWNQDAYVEALARYGELYDEGTLQRSSLDLGYADAMNAFNTGKAAIACNGTWEAGVLRPDFREANGVKASSVGVIPVPADDPESRSLRSFLDITWGIPSSSDNPAAAAAFIDYVSQGDGVDTWANGLGFVPTDAEWQLDPTVLEGDQRAEEGYAEIQRLIANPSSDRNNLSSFSVQVGKYVLEVAQGRMSAQEAADKAQQDLESGLYS